MKAMLLAAGRGERLKPLTDTCPKPLITVAGKPLIEHQILKLKAAGVDNIMVNCAWLAEHIVDFLAQGQPWSIKIETVVEAQGALETAGGIINVLDFFDDEPFWVLSSDIFCDYVLPPTQSLIGDKQAHLLMVDNPEHNPSGDFHLDQQGLLHADGLPKLTFASMGIYTKAFFAGLEPGKRALAPVLRQAMDKGLVSGSKIAHGWTDVGTSKRLALLEHTLKNRHTI